MTHYIDHFVLFEGYQPLTDTEFMAMNEQDETPYCIIAVTKAFAEETFCSEEDRGYKTLDDFLNSYTWDEIDDVIPLAELRGALAFTYCESMDKLYVPENFPAGTEKCLAAFLHENRESRSS